MTDDLTLLQSPPSATKKPANRKDGWVDSKALPPPAPHTTCIEHAYGTTTRLSFQIKVF